MIQPAKEPTVLFGLNGVGKTNVLEAISMFAPGQGFRRAKFSQLTRRPELIGWKLTGEFKILDQFHEIITFWDEISGRKVTIDGKLSSQSELARLVRIIWVTPLMDRLWLDGASDRRRFLDRLVSNVVPEYTENCINYNKALKQRNKLIKQNITDSSWFDALEDQMARTGVEIEKARRNFIDNIIDIQNKSASAFPVADLDIVGTKFSSADELQFLLFNNRKQDFFAGRTLLGPHLSDLHSRYSTRDIEAKNCSTGEQKALLISIIIATAKLQLKVFKTPPILLFDEVSAHLDEERRSILYDELFNLNIQVFLTGTDKNIFKELKHRAKYYHVVLNSDVSVCEPLPKDTF